MVRPALRTAFCLLLGLFAGGILGPMFAPDPTGPLAAVLAVCITVAVSTFLHRSDWLRGQTATA